MAEIMKNTESEKYDATNKSESGNNIDNTIFIRDAVIEAIKGIEKHLNSKIPYIGIPTGFTDFDDLHNGLRKGELIVIASRPLLGKTTLVSNISCNIALRMHKKTDHDKYKVLFFSTFTKRMDVIYRMICSEANISRNNFERNIMTDKDWVALWNSCDNLGSNPYMFINDTTRPSIDEIENTARILHKQKGLDLLVIDSLHFIHPTIKYSNSYDKQLDLTGIASRLKALACKLDIPVIVTATVSARCEDRVNKRPVIADLRDYGKLDEIADTILFLYKEDFYNPVSEDKHSELIIAKDRFSSPDVVNLFFHKDFIKFVGFTKRDL